MERLISLFRDADYEQWSPSHAPSPPAEQKEPLYFQQLLEYLRQEKSKSNRLEDQEVHYGFVELAVSAATVDGGR